MGEYEVVGYIVIGVIILLVIIDAYFATKKHRDNIKLLENINKLNKKDGTTNNKGKG